MSYQVFARKYRPKTFQDLLGQDHVVQTLRNAINQSRLAHAYLFVGPRGTGKTSTARILAKALNWKGGPSIDFDPEDPSCLEIAEGRSLDVIEIDGASNTGVDDVRNIRESASYMPNTGNFKIFYIDEVHMLSKNAFNALLKILEEPPAHVKFIFATTEVHKILPTILSRCQRFDLKPISAGIIAEHLRYIAQQEGVQLSEAAAWAVAKGADGGMRDAQSMLDQLVSFCGNQIEEGQVQEVFGFTSHEKVASMIGWILNKDTVHVLDSIKQEVLLGSDLSQLLTELINGFRSVLVAKLDAQIENNDLPEILWQQLLKASEGIDVENLLLVIDALTDVESRMKWASNKRLYFELGVIKSIHLLSRVRLSDVIKVLAEGTDFIDSNHQAKPEARTQQSAIVRESPPAVVMAKSEAVGIKCLNDLIANAPEEVATPAPEAPTPQVAKIEEPQKQAINPPKEEDPFYQDPLIQAALEKFQAKILAH